MGQEPSDRLNGTAFVIASALRAPSSLLSQVDFLPIYSAYLRDIIKQVMREVSCPLGWVAVTALGWLSSGGGVLLGGLCGVLSSCVLVGGLCRC